MAPSYWNKRNNARMDVQERKRPHSERQMPVEASEKISELPLVPDFPVIQGSIHRKSAISSYESPHPAFRVRDNTFFHFGRVFAIIPAEPASIHAPGAQHSDYASAVKHNTTEDIRFRRFVVVKPKQDFYYALRIFDYRSQDTEHHRDTTSKLAIIYTLGSQPVSLPDELPLQKGPFCVVPSDNDYPPFSITSRVDLSITHPIRYDHKVKDLGRIHSDHLERLIGCWFLENASTDKSCMLPSIMAPSTGHDFEDVRKPRVFFKLGRVFITPWCWPEDHTGQLLTKTAKFIVVKATARSSICVCINSRSEQTNTTLGMAGNHHAALILQGAIVTHHEQGEALTKDPIEMKIENDTLHIDPISRVDFTKLYTVEHNVKVQNLGRVVGPSVARLKHYVAENQVPSPYS